MNRGHLWKLLLILFILAWSFYSMYPPTGRDLFEVFYEKSFKHDAAFTNIVSEYKSLDKKNPNRPYGNLRMAVGTNDLVPYFPEFDVKSEKDPNTYILNRLQREASGKIKLGLDLIGGSSFLVEMQTNKLSEGTSKDVALDNAVEVLRKRVDKFGVAEPLIQKVPGANRIMIQMPGLSQDVMESVRMAIQKAAFLEFRMVHEEGGSLIQQGLIPPGYEIKKETLSSPGGEKEIRQVLVEKKPVPNLSGKNIKAAYVTRDNMNRPEIAFKLDSDGAKVFGDLTTANVGKQMAILLDGELYSAPVIRSAITEGNGVIQGSFQEKEAFDLANVLQNPLEAPVQIISETTVDPSLGRDAIESGVKASIFGTVAVSGFMAVYYLLCGMVANVALIVNIIVLLGVMCSIGSTLTLPGIAGVVLTVGMAVDANVLIFERIREETSKGKSLRGALEAGYARAFGTILDSHVTTLISSVILIYMGTGTIKGFGVALTIGVAASLFTALVVTRLIFDFFLAKNLIKQFRMFHLIPSTLNINFMGVAKVAFVGTWIFIILSCGSGVIFRGEKALGIDFKGGDNLTLRFAQTEKIDVEKIRGVLKQAGMKDPQIQYQREMGAPTETLRITAEAGSGAAAVVGLQKAFPAAKFTLASLDKVGPTIGQEIQKTAVIASLVSLFGILVYVAFRYEFSFAIGAVLAIFHDVFMVIGVYLISGREFNTSTVAAILTMIGFSTNDTIVIFDRIREDLKLGVRGTFKEIINQAINQTLSRTIITSGTVFLATLSLFIFGGGAINDFAFTFLVGIVTGTYSSIYIASALVLWWNKGERPAIGASVALESAAATAKPVRP
jgi:SecD/SecF fusion protein